MDVSDLRRRILRALEDAQKDASTRRTETDEAVKAYEQFLADVAVPLVRQAAIVLNAAKHAAIVHTPAASVRLVSESSPQTFLELVLDVNASPPQVVGRVSVSRGRQGIIVEERPIAAGKAVAALTEDDVSTFLIAEIPKLVMRP